MKLFVGGSGACGVHNEKNMIINYALHSDQITYDYHDADVIIIIDTCVGTYRSIIQSIKYIESVLKTKKSDARVIVSGCLTRKLKISLPSEYQSIIEQVEIIEQDKIVEYAYRLLGFDVSERMRKKIEMLTYTLLPNGIKVSPNVGCQNHCSFCKSNYAEFPLKSAPIESIYSLQRDFAILQERGNPINYVHLQSSNLSLYGVDLYGESKAHEVLNILSQPDSVKFINAGALINWYPGLLNEVLSNPKIKCIFVSLESGSERVYNLMNRPIAFDELKRVIQTIRQQRPDIIINTEFICGFPTETDDEFQQTIDLIGELDINPLHMHPYINSDCIPSAKFKQHPYELCLAREEYAKRQLAPQKVKYSNLIGQSELLVVDIDKESSFYLVMLITGLIVAISFDEVGTGFKIGDLIPVNHGKKPRAFRRVLRKGDVM